MGKVYSWKEVVDITVKAGKSTSKPSGNYRNCLFRLKTIDILSIQKSSYLTIAQYRVLGLIEDIRIVKRLMRKYETGDVPPIILNKKLYVIDGSHRVGALLALKRRKIKAFVLC